MDAVAGVRLTIPRALVDFVQMQVGLDANQLEKAGEDPIGVVGQTRYRTTLDVTIDGLDWWIERATLAVEAPASWGVSVSMRDAIAHTLTALQGARAELTGAAA